jgi:hypothetical protein
MLYKIYKIIFADMEREEAWLNEMADKGFNFLDNFFMRYTFTEGTPNEYIYRIELMKEKPNHPVSQQYIKFLEETGVECVSNSGRWVYFRKKACDGPFDLYSDIDAKIDHYKRIISYVGTILLFNLIVFGLNLTIAITKGLPANYSIAVSVLFFTGLLIKALFHYKKRIKELKEEQRLHE